MPERARYCAAATPAAVEPVEGCLRLCGRRDDRGVAALPSDSMVSGAI